MDSNDLKLDYIRNSHEEAKELNGYHKILMNKAKSHSHNSELFDKEAKGNIINTLGNEDNPQKNIFDHDISIKYNPKRHRNLHMKKHMDNRNNNGDIKLDENSLTNQESQNKDLSQFEKIVFKVKVLKLMNRKSDKIIEVYNTKEGLMKILCADNPDKILTANFSNINKIEGENNSSLLILTALFNGNSKKSIWIEFANTLEKFMFKTHYYNKMVNRIPRTIEGNNLKLNVNVITWNVGGIDFPDDLGILFNSNSLEEIDIYSIGVQECSYFKSNDWQKHLQTLMNYYGFIPVASVDMCQMFLIVFIKSKFSPFLESVRTSYKAMGFAKIIGNKGGIGISFKLFGYTMTFINCHLAPKPYKVLERNTHAKNIVKYLKIGENFGDFDITSDYLFWQGDLNYRVDYNYEEVIQEIERENIKLLLLKDQLIKQRQTNQVFYNFQEAEINFNPTYRRIKGSDEYSNKNNQSPSWCDRIMVKSDRDIHFLYYDSIKSVKHSDHLPVLAKLSINLTYPSLSDISKSMNKSISGKLCYRNIKMNFNFSEAIGEMNLQIKVPLRVRIQGFSFINKYPSETNQILIDDLSQLEKEITFDNMIINFPPQCLYDLEYAKAFSLIFVFILSVGKYNYEIGFSKYSLEKIEKESKNIVNHSLTTDIFLRTRKLGEVSFECEYKF